MTTPAAATTHRGKLWTLTLGALGVVFGDIGTSPLYSLQTIFSLDHNRVATTHQDVYGVISLVFWAVTIVVSIKYVVFILRADNDGEGGDLALAALARRAVPSGGKRFALVMVLGVFSASLFSGDSVITPAISVLSAVEGLAVPAPQLHNVILPISVTIIVILFMVQRFGTSVVGKLFGPVMVVWFVTIAVLGLTKIVPNPAIIRALSPTYALQFWFEHPFVAFIAMGAVVLSITGAEALYADMGHFGRSPIRRAWFFLVFPCLTLNYLGQGALITETPGAIRNPFFLLGPSWAQWPMVILATMATVIASQAVISGAFSMARQAERLGYLPRLTVLHTSEHESGQIYIPSINWALFVGVLVLMLTFRSSQHLATAYGLAVTGTLVLSSTLFLVYAESAWKWPKWRLILVGVLFYSVELTFLAANLAKVIHGGWLPLSIAAVVATTMFTWRRGAAIVSELRRGKEGPLTEFIDYLHGCEVTRVPGVAVFLHPDNETTPLAFRENVAFNHVTHENVFIVSSVSRNVPHVAPEDQFKFSSLGDPYDGVAHIQLNFGFQDDQDVPHALRAAREQGINLDPDEAFYFLSRISVHHGSLPGLSKWRKRLFLGMAHNAANPAVYYRLPEDRTVVMGAQVHF
ncbi:potassium transporter Kup [Flexivirga alba]|uniref:Probable potassium transport system protein Kup n=1 Tax=Flexivirga alba TaxID=702742 RepID=A0ABW2AAW3_9MICO